MGSTEHTTAGYPSQGHDLPGITSRPIDHARPIKVICIGAGISGLLTAIRFPQHIENLDLVVYEKNPDLGGTWYENRYPGISCDIPSHAYQFTFENNPNWSRLYAPGSEILAYLNHVADKYGARKYMKFRHEFKSATWNEASGKWTIELLDLAQGTILHDSADIFVKATGTLNDWKWPDIPGLHDFKGELLHSARWDSSFDVTGKNVAVIGNGSTGIQVVPALQPAAKHIDTYIRSKAWVSPQGAFGKQVAARGGEENFAHSEEEKRHFQENPDALVEFRRDLEETLHMAYLGIFRDKPEKAEATARLEKIVKAKLVSKPGLFELVKPEWPVGCKRLGASPGFLEAITKDNVDVITSGIQKVVAEGIVDWDDVVRKVDAIVCATGFDTTLNMNKTPIIGQDGITLAQVWDPEPHAYLAICPPKMPNMFLYLGPNGSPNSTMIVMIEFQCDYMIKAIQKLQREYIKSMVPRADATNDFVRFADEYFEKTVLTERCASWVKSGGREDGRITAMWPGSLPHAWRAYQSPRWEDFEYQRCGEIEGNRFAWMGNGLVKGQVEKTKTTLYLDHVDKPPVSKDYDGQ